MKRVHLNQIKYLNLMMPNDYLDVRQATTNRNDRNRL